LRADEALQVPFVEVPAVRLSVITPVVNPVSEILTLAEEFRIKVAVTELTPD
jgi:hypothetical protein